MFVIVRRRGGVAMWLVSIVPQRWGERDHAMRFATRGEARRAATVLKLSGDLGDRGSSRTIAAVYMTVQRRGCSSPELQPLQRKFLVDRLCSRRTIGANGCRDGVRTEPPVSHKCGTRARREMPVEFWLSEIGHPPCAGYWPSAGDWMPVARIFAGSAADFLRPRLFSSL